MPSLGGRVVACLEARHADELAELVVRHGGITYPAPCLREVHEPDTAETRLAVELLCKNSVPAAVFLTGVGVDTIVEGARRLDQLDALVTGLSNKRIAARGPKTVNALRRLGVGVDVIAPEPFTSAALLVEIERAWRLEGQTVLVQRYGGAPVFDFAAGLRGLGAQVVEVSPYHWERPLDEQPVVRLIEDLVAGWIDVLAATNAAQVDHLFDIARDRGCESSLRLALAEPRLRVAAQGIVCASAFERRGIAVDCIPPRASMGALVMAIIGHVDGEPAPDDRASHQPRDGLIAVFVADDVAVADVRGVLAELSAGATIGLLAGKSRRGERTVELAAIDAALAVERVRPDRSPLHPADELVRRATSVVIFANEQSDVRVGRLLKLADRYAKPVRVVRAEAQASAGGVAQDP